MASAAFKYVPQTAATTFAFSYVYSKYFFYEPQEEFVNRFFKILYIIIITYYIKCCALLYFVAFSSIKKFVFIFYLYCKIKPLSAFLADWEQLNIFL